MEKEKGESRRKSKVENGVEENKRKGNREE